jgi:N-acetylglucosaminyldiphosphoundecaprenol N-acetyl-beta-D-mannosaminyltransferase
MDDTLIVERINAADAGFLLVALGAQKVQAWLFRNRHALNVPVVSHLGATLNFLAGRVKRAPAGFRKPGMEWLWRVKEEPHLATRYFADGVQLLWLGLTRVVPLGIWLRWHGAARSPEGPGVWLDADQTAQSRIIIAGAARDGHLHAVRVVFRSAAAAGQGIVLDVQGLQFFGMGFAGQVLMLEKAVLQQNLSLSIVGATPSLARALKWCGLGHLMGKTGL